MNSTTVNVSAEEAAFLQPTTPISKTDSDLDLHDSWGGGLSALPSENPFPTSSSAAQDASFFMGSLLDDDDDDDESGTTSSIYSDQSRNDDASLAPTKLARARSDDFMYKTSYRHRKSKPFPSSAYKGPTPLGPDGKPLKSSLRTKSAPPHQSLTPTEEESITQPPPPKLKRAVSFTEISMRKYERTLGDHPCVSSGAPITLGWKFHQYDSVPLDDYETARGPALPKEQIRIPAEVRLNMLLTQADVSLREVKSAELQAMKERAELIKSMKNGKKGNKGSQKMEELSESAKRKLKRIVNRTSKKRQEDELWIKAQEHAMKKFDEGGGGGETNCFRIMERCDNSRKYGRRWSAF